MTNPSFTPTRTTNAVAEMVTTFLRRQRAGGSCIDERDLVYVHTLDGARARQALDDAYVAIITIGYQAQQAESWVRDIAESTDLQYVVSDYLRKRAAIACGYTAL